MAADEPSPEPDVDAELEALARRWLDPDGPGAWRMLLAVLVPLMAWFASGPRVVLTDEPLDVFVPLNDVWRLVHGERLHLDLHTPVGAVYDLSHLAAHALVGDARLLLVAPVGLALGVLALAWTSGAGRLPALGQLIGVSLVVLLVASPLDTDTWSPGVWPHLAVYNRLGWALSIVVLLATLRPGTTPGLREGLGVALALLALAFTKITFFALGGFALLVALVDRPDRRRWALAVGVGVWVVLLAAWALSEYKFKGNTLLGLYMAIGIMVPIRLGSVSILQLIVDMGLTNTLTALVLVYVAQSLPLAIFILSEFMQQIPGDLKEAARCDGISEYGIFFHIILPLVRPAIATVGVFTMVPIWNDLWFPLILAPSPETATITLGVQQFIGQYVTDWNSVLSSLTMAILPVLVIYLIFSRQLIRGITSGAVK